MKSQTAPYQQIASALREKIEAGELPPGAKVPSTRMLAQEWGVATATAAHALKTLTQEGLIRGVSRRGTIVAGVSKPSPRREGELSRERIVAAAIQLADAEGLTSLSLRSVAARLSSPVMSLYRHIKSKSELCAFMIDAVLQEEKLPHDQPFSWRASLELVSRLQWRGVKRHPWLARLVSLSRPSPFPSGIAHAEWVLQALDGYGLDAADKMRIHMILFSFVQGLAVNLETESEDTIETGISDEQWMQSQQGAFDAIAASGKFPAFASMLRELRAGFDLDFDLLFEVGLRALLDGFASLIESKTRTS
jgi:DNA-binding transcriptional regulator YhcF (GntR family)